MSILWIGGSSGLARTYLNYYDHTDFILTGVEALPPAWAHDTPYRCIDLRGHNLIKGCLKEFFNISTIIVGVRAPLVTGNGRHEDLLDGLQLLLGEAMQLPNLQRILHISSVAAANHLQAQVNMKETEPIPPLSSYEGSYDIFKRRSEDIITALCTAHNKAFCHLRISAIFSDSHDCIQCGALALQSVAGAYIPTKIDCNSAKNVAAAISIMLHHRFGGQPVYYYTRPTHDAVPYGDYLLAYRHAYEVYFTVWIPFPVVVWFVWLVHVLVVHVLGQLSATAMSINYLLQVSAVEHSFNNDLFRADFPQIVETQESIYECFRRRRALMTGKSIAEVRSD